MLPIPDYTFTEKIHEGTKTQIFRGYHNPDRTPVIVKVPNSEYPSLPDLAKFKHEYEIIQQLDFEGVVKPHSLVKYHNGLALVFKDIGGDSLKQAFSQKPLELPFFWNWHSRSQTFLAISITIKSFIKTSNRTISSITL